MNFKMITDFINSNDRNAKQRIEEDTTKYVIYNGRLREIIYEKLMQEFKDPKTIRELHNRIVPINLMRKMVEKLAKVYRNAALRAPKDTLPGDQDLIDMYSRSFDINNNMQYANKLFKLHKAVLVEPYLNTNGVPKLRAVPSQAYWLFSDDTINPEKPTKIVKMIVDAKEPKDRRYAVWTNKEHYIIDGNGAVDNAKMLAMNNEEGVNPYGVLPFVYINEAMDMLYPLRPTDLISVQIATCLLLSDACLAQKYLSWATLTIIGADGEKDIHVGPGATLQIPRSADGTLPDVKYLQPSLNVKEVLELVDKNIEYLLYTNNLSAGQSIGKMSGGNMASGAAKMVDESQSTEDKQEQQKFFEEAEKELWEKFAHNILPVWVESGLIDPEYAGAFSKDFELSIAFRDMKPMLTEKEQVEIILLKLNNGLITKQGALKEIHQDKSEEEIKEIENNIESEKITLMGALLGNTDKEPDGESDTND